ncbi:MAG: hypothetical protein EPN85_09060 [Bacteroidetes bacterium]|nr:MAG: hypothetical protein EPN85_09060 [Bacteroidota bacterium]
MKTINAAIQMTGVLAAKLDQSILSKFMIGRKIAKLFKNKVQRTIFFILWFGKTILFYWLIW